MNEAVSRLDIWRHRFRRVRALARRALPFALGVLAVLVAILIYTTAVPPPHPLTVGDVDNEVAQVLASATAPPAVSSLVFLVIQPSVVLVEIKPPGSNSNTLNENGIDLAAAYHSDPFARMRVPDNTSAIGSGVVVDDSGDILTSLEIVSQAGDLEVTFSDGTQSSAKIVGTQPQNDIAILRADQPPGIMVPAILGNPNAMRVGDDAYVVGNPFDLYASLSAGVISGLNRTFQKQNSPQKLQGLLQFDAAVNPGNFGGPLVNRAGQVVGIVIGLINPTGQNAFAGVGFAVPITTAAGGVGLPPD